MNSDKPVVALPTIGIGNPARLYIKYVHEQFNPAVNMDARTGSFREIKEEDVFPNITERDLSVAQIKFLCQFCLEHVRRDTSKIQLSEVLKQSFFEITQEKVRIS